MAKKNTVVDGLWLRAGQDTNYMIGILKIEDPSTGSEMFLMGVTEGENLSEDIKRIERTGIRIRPYELISFLGGRIDE